MELGADGGRTPSKSRAPAKDPAESCAYGRQIRYCGGGTPKTNSRGQLMQNVVKRTKAGKNEGPLLPGTTSVGAAVDITATRAFSPAYAQQTNAAALRR